MKGSRLKSNGLLCSRHSHCLPLISPTKPIVQRLECVVKHERSFCVMASQLRSYAAEAFRPRPCCCCNGVDSKNSVAKGCIPRALILDLGICPSIVQYRQRQPHRSELHAASTPPLYAQMSLSIFSRALARASGASRPFQRPNGGSSVVCAIRRRTFADASVDDMALPLKGYRILDMTRVLAGVRTHLQLHSSS